MMAKIKAAPNGSRQDTIVRKAAALFRKKGYQASSMRDIAEAVGVEASSLYNHIGSKKELLQKICFGVAEAFQQHLQEISKPVLKPSEKLGKLLQFHFTMMENHFDELYVANHEWKQLTGVWLDQYLKQRKAYEAAWVTVIEAGIKQGEFRKINPEVAVITLLTAVRGLEYWHRHQKSGNPKTLEKDMLKLLLHGLINT